ncbi:Ferric/cupric reductase transmembrane component 7 [Tolypocladium capitatum]|uniref:ferric-chelate reductase (NADPH) n=1 Tax=Tolypocladium capitatum TaxID=45235 RepID=A0A2K3Q6D3_9HYPO|nr:Ferric/cupric reductase transmembrane component 7 [Tolypocladium capitatum]
MDMDMPMPAGVGSETNYAFARDYWYIVAGATGLLVAIRGVNAYGARQRLAACNDPSVEQPTRPDGALSQAWATATAVVRELGHPQLYLPARGLRWATPPPLGRVLVLLCYWAVVVYLMSWDAVVDDAYYWERIGYRNAWVSVAQLPLLFLLAMKLNPVGWLVGSSHERLSWLHRWVARTMLVTATMHGFHFWTEWVRQDVVRVELAMMPLVRYGFGAWGILLWSVIVGLVPIRRLAYEAWLLQHIASSVVLLWLLYKHIPDNAKYHLWMAVSFLVFDRAARWLLLLWQNTRWKTPDGSSCRGRGMKRAGHDVSLRAVGDATTVVTIEDVHFKWRAGQHVYLWVPRLGPLEAHPYTVACAHRSGGSCCCNSIQLVVRAHGGFSKRIHTYASRHPEKSLTGFVSGPYGAPPRWDTYETLVLIGASTGASFAVPMLECAAAAEHGTCVRRIEVALMARTGDEIEYYVQRAAEAAQAARRKGIDVRLHVAITGRDSERKPGGPLVQLPQTRSNAAGAVEKPDGSMTSASCTDGPPDQAGGGGCRRRDSSSTASSVDLIREYRTRLDIEALIRAPVEQAWGETAVVVCGGREVVARTRNCVSRLSDERAVHKGTGAQGIYLHVEEYAF